MATAPFAAFANTNSWQTPVLQPPPRQSWPQLPQFFGSDVVFATHTTASPSSAASPITSALASAGEPASPPPLTPQTGKPAALLAQPCTPEATITVRASRPAAISSQTALLRAIMPGAASFHSVP